jgi:hypothetical protein
MIVTRILLQDIKIHHSKVMVDNLKKIDMKLPILELAQLKTKAERRPFCEEYGLSHKQLKRIIDDYNQGKYKVENEYIEVAPPSGEARELPNVPQTTIGQEPAVRKVPQAPSQGGWCYEIQNDKSHQKISGTDGKIPEKVVNAFMFNQIVSGLKAFAEAVCLFKELFFPNK